MHLARALPVNFMWACHKLFDRHYKIFIDKADVFIDAIFISKLVIAVLYHCMFESLMILNCS